MVELIKNNRLQTLNIKPIDLESIKQFHQSIPGFKPSLLVPLSNLAQQLEVGPVFIKDESNRFGLKAFKGMGASYAIYRFIKKRFEETFGVMFQLGQLYDKAILNQLNLPPFATATDGNHGRAVAWFARILGLEAIIYIPQDAVPARIENIKKEGAKVIEVDGSYDQTVRSCAEDAKNFGYQVIADTAYENYYEIPEYITEGYLSLLDEIDHQLEFDFIFVQCGVGSFAAAVVIYYKFIKQGQAPKIILVEPANSACVFESFQAGYLTQSKGNLKTIMAGLNCGTPSEIAWPILRDGVDYFLTVDDHYAKKAMYRYYHPIGNDPQIISGESGSAGLAALLSLKESGLWEQIGINKNSKILLFNTERDTDPESFSRITSQSHT